MKRKQVSDIWERGDSYERYVGRWSRQVAPKFLSWLNIPIRRRWLDVGCGTGALSASIVELCSPSLAFGIELSEGFLSSAKRNLANRVRFCRGSATELPLTTSSADVVVSGLVLNFLPDQRIALTEMARVTDKEGIIGAYVWDYAGKMEVLRNFWDTVLELNPDDERLVEGIRFPMCNPEALKHLFASAGLNEIEVAAIDTLAQFDNFEDYWQPFLGGQGPAPAYVMTLDAVERARLREHLRERVPVEADGSITLVARAWAIRGTVVK